MSDGPNICCDCVGEPYLRSIVIQDGTEAVCEYCDNDDQPCITLEDLADHIEGAFERHYYRTSDQPDMYEAMLQGDRELEYEWERHGEPVLYAIQEAAAIEEQVAQDVLDILEERNSDIEAAQMGDECEFAPDSHYEWKNIKDHEFAFEWRNIERSLKSEARFFNQGAEAFLARLFANLEGRTTREGNSVVVSAGPDTEVESFFRARVIHKSADFDAAMMRPDLHLGPPPAHLARAGRMNANGISMFYGASDKGVALAEVRPPVGSRALVGEFQLTRRVRLLDVTALQSVYVEGSIFDPNYIDQMSLAKFLGRLSERITMPVMPDDEPTEYLITQMIADYLARQPVPGLDGILFPSVQSPGEHRNVVLFHHASRVEELDLPEGTDLKAYQTETTEDGPEVSYRVWEEVPEPKEAAEKPEDALGLFAMLKPTDFDFDGDFRETTLRVVLDSITAQHVRSVKFDPVEYEVDRHRTVKREWNLLPAPKPGEPEDFPF